MDWLIIIGLAGWVWWQSRRIETLSRRLSELELRTPARAPTIAPSAPAPMPTAAPPAPALLEPVILDTPIYEAEEPLLLDTPIPEASNDTAAPHAAAEPTPAPEAVAEPLLLTEVVPPSVPSAPPPTPPAPPTAPKRERRFEEWLAENGLAWLGAAAFAFGGIFLVSYAAQQNWFTPQVRLVCALIFGVALIGASEWVRRRAQNKLVASLLAGAGAATFYATAWATHGLYHYVDWPLAAVLLTLCALIIIALSFIHGEALGVLAMVAALLAPPLTSMDAWPTVAVTLYVGAVGVAGLVLAHLRRWPWAGVATLSGLYFWFAAAIEIGEVRRALMLLSIASVGGVSIAARPAQADEAKAPLTWSQARQLGPTIAICIGSVFLIFAWLAVAPADSGRVAGPALIAVFHVALAAYAIRARVAAPAALAVAIGALVFGFASYISARASFGQLSADFYPTTLFAAFTVTVSALGARAHRTARALTAGAGAIGAALLTLLSASTRSDWHSLQAWAPMFMGAMLLTAAAWRAGRDVAEPEKDRAVDFWSGGAAALLLIGVESAFPAAIRTIADAAAALLFAAGLNMRRWRMLRVATLTAAALALAHALSPDLINAALTGEMPLWRALLYLAATAAALFAAGRVIARKTPNAPTAEALNSASLITVLIALFLGLRWLAAGGSGARLDDFTETALRALTLIAAGHITLPRGGETTGIISKWRGHVLMGLGLLYAFSALGLAENPWWGSTPAKIDGPPLLNGLLLGFGAPAALALAAANRLYRGERTPARLYVASGGVFVLLWAILEIRRAFHVLSMPTAAVGVFEGACYGVAVLMLALAIAAIPRLRTQTETRPFTRDLSLIASGSAWAGLAFSVFMLLVSRHPWWGAQYAPGSDSMDTGMGVLAQAWASTLALGLGRALSRGRGVDAVRFAAAAAAALFALSFGHAAIRWFYHGGGMDDGAPLVQLEGFAHALWPLALILGASAVTTRAPGRDTVRPYLYDLEAIWSVAIWPALVFAALGLWFVFNPWWGSAAVSAQSPLALAFALIAYATAAAMSAASMRVPHVALSTWMERAAVIACVGHLFVGVTLAMRFSFHGYDAATALASDVEMWTYSAVWALFGAATLAVGLWRNNPTLRWVGIALLLITAAKVFLVDSARLSGIIRVLSLIGLGVVLTLVALGTRRFRQAPPPSPSDLLKTIPSGRRERRNVRR